MKKQRGFVRVIWGAFLEEDEDALKDIEKEYGVKQDTENSMLNRRVKIERDIKRCFDKDKFHIPSVTYVFGKRNYDRLVEMGLECVLIHDEPYKYHPIKGIYRHKLDAYRHMMADYEECVFIDFDCRLKTKLPDNFWEVLNKKEVLQASLHKYSTPRMNHRDMGNKRTSLFANKMTPTGAFVYMRGEYVADRMFELNMAGGPNTWSCEPVMGILSDEICGGWQGIAKYWELFEPEFYTAKRSPFRWDREKYKKGNSCFRV